MSESKLVFRKFRSYMAKNCLMVLLLCVIIVPLCTVYYRSNVNFIIKTQQDALDANVALFNTQLGMLDSLIEDFTFTQQARLFALESALKPADYITVQSLHENVRTLSLSSNLITDIFIVCENSDTVITTQGNFTSTDGLSGKDRFLSYYIFENDGFAQEVRNPVNALETRFTRGMKVDCPSYPTTREAAYVYSKPIGYNVSNIHFYLLFDKAGLETLFGSSQGTLSLSDLHGNELITLFEEETADEKNPRVLESSGVYRVNASLRLSVDSYRNVLDITFLTILLFALGMVVLSFTLAVINAYSSCKPLHKIINRLKDFNLDVANYDEAFSYLLSSVETMEMRRESSEAKLSEVQTQMSKIYIERCLRIPAAVLQSAGNAVDIESFPQNYVVGYMMILTDGPHEQQDLQLISAMICNQLADHFNGILQQLQPFSFALIIPAVSDHDRQLLKLREEVLSLSQNFELHIALAVSNVYEGIAQLNAAYENARSVMAASFYQPGVHSPADIGVKTADVQPQTDISQLYHAVLEANYSLARDILLDLLMESYHFISIEQRYNYARTTLALAHYSITRETKCDAPTYSSHLSPKQLFDQLCDFSMTLCKRAAIESEGMEPKLAEEGVRSDQAVQYIRGHFANDELSVQLICSECAINEKTLNEVCREYVGMNASTYIRQLRMDKASSLLRNTDLLVIDILKECGYNTPNAFYKAFKQIYGRSPSEYRATFQ